MAHFRTAYEQREILVDGAVKGTTVGAEDIKVGTLVKLTDATDTLPAYIEKVTSLAIATHIVAQSDMTQEYGHIPIENQDYRPNYSVKATFTGTAPYVLAADTPTKKIAMFLLNDKTDIILSAGETV